MDLRYLGYVGQNHTLKRTTGRTLRLANLTPERVTEVTAANLTSLRVILEWNLEHDIRFFRIASSLVPFASHERFPLDWRETFAAELRDLRDFVDAFGIRLSTHPGQYTVLNSPHPKVVEDALAELEYHASLLQAVAPADGTMTVHVGGVYGDREGAIERFVTGARRLSPQARARLIVENDDRLFDVDDALRAARALGVPVVFDFFHHRCHHRRGDPDAGLPGLLAEVVATWGDAIPKFHLSSARVEGSTHHADHVSDEDFAAATGLLAALPDPRPYDLMLEAKAKERAVLRHMG